MLERRLVLHLHLLPTGFVCLGKNIHQPCSALSFYETKVSLLFQFSSWVFSIYYVGVSHFVARTIMLVIQVRGDL
jgi:hypothetical protein